MESTEQMKIIILTILTYALKGHGLHLALGIALGFSVHVIFAL